MILVLILLIATSRTETIATTSPVCAASFNLVSADSKNAVDRFSAAAATVAADLTDVMRKTWFVSKMLRA